MRKMYAISSFVLLLLVSFLGITYSYEYNENEFLKFELIGDYILRLPLNDDYVEYGVKITNKGKDISSLVEIDTTMLDMNKVGEYPVKYEIDVDGTTEYIYRIVKVEENIKPQIILLGDKVVYLELNDEYVEAGYKAIDNYDMDIENKVVITGEVDVTKVGEYEMEYKVVDSSGNESVAKRIIVVK